MIDNFFMKRTGLLKSIFLLSILPSKYRKNVISHLSIFEKKLIFDTIKNYDGFFYFNNKLNSKNALYLLKTIRKMQLKKISDIPKIDIAFSFLIILFGIVTLIFLLFSSILEDFINNFILYGYAGIFGPVLLLYLINSRKFNFKLNFTNKRVFIRHIIEAIFTSILLIILLFQINAFSQSISVNNINIINLFFIVFFIPLSEELIYRYILISIVLKKFNIFLRIIFSGILFSVMHFPFFSIYILILYLICALILSILYSIENYLFPCFLAHSISNLVIFLINF